MLSPGPPLGATTPWGTNGLAETAAAGVNVYRTGTGGIWSADDIQTALAWNRAAAALHVYTWPNLGGYSLALPGSSDDEGLAQVVDTLTNDPSSSAIAFWKGRDEPWYSDIACRPRSSSPTAASPLAASLLVRRRGPARPEPALGDHRGSARHRRRPRPVLQRHRRPRRRHLPGLPAHPVPNLHAVGRWTATLASITPLSPVWTTIQICASGSYDKNDRRLRPPHLPARAVHGLRRDPERSQGAQLLSAATSQAASAAATPRTAGTGASGRPSSSPSYEQLSASSAIAPALVNAARAPQVTTGGTGTETMVRQGTSVDDLWLIAARNGAGTRTVTFKGLPRWAHRADVYTENRTVTASAGSFSDRFSQWDVHVYHFVEPLSLFGGWRRPGRRSASHVTLQGKGLAAAKSGQLRRRQGPLQDRRRQQARGHRSPAGEERADRRHLRLSSRFETKTTFRIVPSAKRKPRITGIARLGHRLKATTGVWYEKPSGYRFRWLGCNRHGNDCRPLPGATRRTLALGRSELGLRLRIVVTARTGSGRGASRHRSQCPSRRRPPSSEAS